ncbi:MAG TPA: glycosyltransferase, partial [Euryarchaeota archaeon]|nr:glycosyltransferase [Euryarchaeota archaeon]
MLISVVITVKNEQRHMRDLLDSLVVQKGPIEVIIVDAHSEDDTINIVKSFMKDFDFIKLLTYGGTRARSRNRGAEIAKGDAIAFVDGDMIINPFWAEEMRKSLKKHHVVAGKTIQIGYHAFEDLVGVGMVVKGSDVTYPSCNLAYRKKALAVISGFDSWFITAEDIDLNYRAVLNGYDIAYNPDAIAYHRTRGKFVNFIKQAFWNGAGRKQLSIKHG